MAPHTHTHTEVSLLLWFLMLTHDMFIHIGLNLFHKLHELGFLCFMLFSILSVVFSILDVSFGVIICVLTPHSRWTPPKKKTLLKADSVNWVFVFGENSDCIRSILVASNGVALGCVGRSFPFLLEMCKLSFWWNFLFYKIHSSGLTSNGIG